MKAKHCVAVLATAATLIPALWAVVHAADKPDGSVPRPTYAASQREALRGVQGFRVLVEGLKPEVERLGLTCDALQTDTELQLRQHDIKVLSEQEWLRPTLYVNVNVHAADDDRQSLLPVNIRVEFRQWVLLMRDPAIRCSATTWDSEGLGMFGRTNLHRVREYTRDLVAKFINDYLAANPKQPAPTQEDRGSEAK